MNEGACYVVLNNRFRYCKGALRLLLLRVTEGFMSLSPFSILFVQLFLQRVPVHRAATATTRCPGTKSWALRLLLLHSVHLFMLCFSFISCAHHLPLPQSLYTLLSLVLSVAAGMKTTVSEAEHPLLCEGTRRVKGDLALALMITYKDDQSKLKKVMVTVRRVTVTLGRLHLRHVPCMHPLSQLGMCCHEVTMKMKKRPFSVSKD